MLLAHRSAKLCFSKKISTFSIQHLHGLLIFSETVYSLLYNALLASEHLMSLHYDLAHSDTIHTFFLYQIQLLCLFV